MDPASSTRSHTKKNSPDITSNPHHDASPSISPGATQTPKPLTADRLKALLQMPRIDSFCRLISKCLFNGKSTTTWNRCFYSCKRLLYKHIMDSGKQFLALVIPKSWKYTVLVGAHNKLGHQGNSHTYCLIKRQYYWHGMNKDIRKYIANCVLCCREKAKVQHYPLQMTEIPYRPVDKIATDLIMECSALTSGNKHILIIIDPLTGWPETFPIPDKTVDMIVSTFINEYLPVHMCPQYILLDNGMEFKNSLMNHVLQQLGIDRMFSGPIPPTE